MVARFSVHAFSTGCQPAPWLLTSASAAGSVQAENSQGKSTWGEPFSYVTKA